MRITSIVSLVILLALAATAHATPQPVCYVSKETFASDSYMGADAGNASHPFQTATVALERNVGGVYQCNTVRFKPGTYDQNIKIVRRGDWAPILVSTTNGLGSVFINGVQNTTDLDYTAQAAVLILDSTHVTVEQLDIVNDVNEFCSPNHYPVQPPLHPTHCYGAGILIQDRATVADGLAGHHITIRNNRIHNIRASTLVFGGIRPYYALPVHVESSRDGLFPGTSSIDPSETIHHVRIENNQIYDCDNNSDQWAIASLTISANVENVLVGNNHIHHVTPTAAQTAAAAISVRGEGITTGSPANAQGQPRKVVVRANYIHHITGVGTFVNFATDVLIERNEIQHAPIGMQVVSEGCKVSHTAPTYVPCPAALRAKRVWLRDNMIARTTSNSVDIGRKNQNYDWVDDVYVTNNTMVADASTAPHGGAGTENPTVLLRAGIGGSSRYRNNLVVMNWVPSPPPGPLTARLFRRDINTATPMSMSMDHDLWFVKSTGTPVTDLDQWGTYDWQAMTNPVSFFGWSGHAPFDTSSLNVDPQLSQVNYHLAATSPAINAGAAVGTPPWVPSPSGPSNFGDYNNVGYSASGPTMTELDAFGATRVSGGTIDIGMEERP